MSKKQLGQFFTTKVDSILKGFEDTVIGKDVTDPFAGKSDLLNWAKSNGAKTIKGFDIDNAYIDNKSVFYKDSLRTQNKYDFVITNPPYLYQTKIVGDNIELLKNSKHTDLYQVSLERILDSEEGIVIVPVNFLCSKGARHIRKSFFRIFRITKVSYFTEAVFDDTPATVIAFHYMRLKDQCDKMTLNFTIYPAGIERSYEISKNCMDWQIGGDWLKEVGKYKNKLKIGQVTRKNIESGDQKLQIAFTHVKKIQEIKVSIKTSECLSRNIILLKTLDSSATSGLLCLEDIRNYGVTTLLNKDTSRNQAHLIFPEFVTISRQEDLIREFNELILERRSFYHSLFLRNMRESGRKRISFNLVYHILNYLYFQK